MHPVLFKIGPVELYTYGLFVAIGFLTAIQVARYEAVRQGIDSQAVMDMFFYVLVAAIVGSRLFYVATAPESFISDPIEIFKIWNGGLVFYGGFIGALITAVLYVKHRGLPLWAVADLTAPAIALGHALGRVGCFFAGCCYGKACNLPWAVTFHDEKSLAPQGIPLHPTQLYHAISNFLIFLILFFIIRKRKSFDGQVFWAYVLLYGVTRSALETLRGDFRGEVFLNLFSVSQVIGMGMALLAVVMLVMLKKQDADGNSDA